MTQWTGKHQYTVQYVNLILLLITDQQPVLLIDYFLLPGHLPSSINFPPDIPPQTDPLISQVTTIH